MTTVDKQKKPPEPQSQEQTTGVRRAEENLCFVRGYMVVRNRHRRPWPERWRVEIVEDRTYAVGSRNVKWIVSALLEAIERPRVWDAERWLEPTEIHVPARCGGRDEWTFGTLGKARKEAVILAQLVGSAMLPEHLEIIESQGIGTQP